MAKSFKIISITLLLFILCSCSLSIPVSGTPTPVDRFKDLLIQATKTVTAQKGSIVGRVISKTENGKPLGQTIVRLAGIQYDKDKNPLGWVMEGGTSPGTFTDADGYFVINNIAASDYVMIIGDINSAYYVLVKPDGKQAIIYTVQAGQVLNVQTIEAVYPEK